VITLYWIYRGLRRGFYPALNVFFVFFVPLLLTLNYYDLMFGVVAWIKPDTTATTRETLAFMGTYMATFFICLYFCLWLCAEVMPIHEVVDLVGGGLLGLATGIVCSGVLMLFWFSMPFARRDFPVDDTQMFYKPHERALEAATVVAKSIEGDRAFSGERFLRDLRYGLPGFSTSLGSGFYVASIPNGLRLFTAQGGPPAGFLVRVKELLGKSKEELTPSEQKQVWGEKDRTPASINEGGASALVAVVMEDVPPEIVASARDSSGKEDASKMFRDDGEVYYSLEFVGNRREFIRIYEVKKDAGIGSVIALFQPADPELSVMVEDNFLPSKACFPFNDDEMIRQLTRSGAEEKDARSLLPQLHLGGKALFTGTDQDPYVVEIERPDKWNIFPVQEGGHPAQASQPNGPPPR